MNFAQAVKGPITRSAKQQTILSAAHTEFGRDITAAEKNLLLQIFGLNEIYERLQKVIGIVLIFLN